MCNIRHLQAVSAAAVLSALPALSSAQTVAYSASPVTVTNCSVNATYFPATSFDSPNGKLLSNDVTLSFVNYANVRATSVKFALDDGRSTKTIVDAGSFAAGITIDHTFLADLGLEAGQSVRCSVAEVNFADGGSWRATGHGVATL